MSGTNTKNDVTISIGAVLTNLNKQLKTAKKQVQSALGSGKNITPALKNYEAIEKNVNRINRAVLPAKKAFAGWALSIMFFGMALKRVFDTIWKSSTKTFKDVMASVDDSTNSFSILDGEMKYLGFTIGQALEPVAGFLIPIIEVVSDWVTENEDLVAIILSLSGILGTMFLAGGMGKLALDGFAELGEKISGVKSKALDLKNFDWKSIGNTISKGIGLISIGFAIVAAKDAMDNLKKGKGLSGAIDSLQAGLLAAGGTMLLKGSKAGGYLVAIGFTLDLVQNAKLFQTVTQIFGWIFSFIQTEADLISHTIENGIIDGFLNGLNKMIASSPAGVISKMFGADLEKTLDNLMGIKDTTFDFADEWRRNQAELQSMAEVYDEFFKKQINIADAIAQTTALLQGRDIGVSLSTQDVSTMGLEELKKVFALDRSLEQKFGTEGIIGRDIEDLITRTLRQANQHTYNIENLNLEADDTRQFIEELLANTQRYS